MVLSDHDIKIEIEKGRIVLDPFCAELIQPASIDVRLGNDFRVFRNSDHVAIDPELHQPDLTEPTGTPLCCTPVSLFWALRWSASAFRMTCWASLRARALWVAWA